MQTTQRTCSACSATAAPDDRFGGECGAVLEAQRTAERGEIPNERSVDALALAAAVRLEFSPDSRETSGTLLAERGKLAFFCTDVDATLLVPLSELGDPSLTRVGPVNALTFGAAGTYECFLLKDGNEFFEALSEMLAGDAQSSLRLRTLSANFTEHAREIVSDSFTVGELLKSPSAAESFMRLVALVVGEAP